MLASGGTSTTSPTKVAQTASAPVPAIPSAPTPRSGTLSVISIDPEWLEYLLDSTPPSPDVLSLTQMETATSTTPDEQAQTVDSLADILDGLSTDDTAVNIPPPPPPFVPASPAHIDG